MRQLMENWRRYVNEQETIALGQCYPFAIEMASEWSNSMIDRTKPPGKGVHPDIDNKDKFKVVHGRVTDKFSGESVLHAWVEKGDVVFDAQSSHTKPDGIPKEVYYDMYQPEAHEEYTAEETMLKCLGAGHKGPWTDMKEGSQWGNFTGGAAPLDEPPLDSGPVPPDQLRKLWGIYIEMGMSPEEILQTPEFVEAGITSPEQLQEAITLDIEVGDIVLGGKYKNKRIEVKEIGTDDIGQPTINGKSLLKFRIEKHLPDEKKSKKTKDAEEAEEADQG